MYKVVIVDDEIVVREGIRNTFPWEASDFTLCGEAPDGEMALSMLQDLKPDILVTDIRMPFMDGLQLARKVAQTMPWMHTVILSGYDDFQYAQEAISIGVKEYLLKPVSAQKLEETLKRVAEKISEERARQADLDLLRGQVASTAHYAREQLLVRLLEGGATKTLGAQAQELHMDLQARHYLVMLLGGIVPEQRLMTQGVVQRLIEGMGKRAYCAWMHGELALLLLGEDEGKIDAEELEEHAYSLAAALTHETGQSDILLPSIAIGAPVSRLEELPKALVSAQAILQSIQGQGRRIVGSADVDLSAYTKLMEGEMLPLHEKLRYATKKESEAIVADYFSSMGARATQSIVVLNYMLMDTLLAATRIVKQCGGDPAKVLPGHLMQEGALLRLSETPEKAQEAGAEIVAAALAFRDAHSFSRYGEVLRKARAYIEENFGRPEITLSDVAGHVALSNNHFCTVFSQEMGRTFTEYLTDVRIDKAKELLRTSAKRTSDIAYAVGYNDPHYFSYLFKKNEGMSPRDFRKKEQPSE